MINALQKWGDSIAMNIRDVRDDEILLVGKVRDFIERELWYKTTINMNCG